MGVSDNLSSEIGLFLIILLIFLCFTFLKRKKFLKNFLIFYLSFNLLFSIIQFIKEFQNQNNFHIKLENIKNLQTESIKRSNIYFFILDGMMPLNEFENYYKNDFSEFKDFYNQKKYLYFKDTLNTYNTTANTLTSWFFLEEIFIEPNNYEISNLKPNIYKRFPGLLNKKYNQY